MLVLEPIFEADLPREQHAYRPGRNARQAVVEVEALLFRGLLREHSTLPKAGLPFHVASEANAGVGGAEAVDTRAKGQTETREKHAHAVAAFTAHMLASSTAV
jgi:hypothetical protein